MRPADVAAAAGQAAAAEMPPAYAVYLAALAAAVRDPVEGTLAALHEAAAALLESLPQDAAPDFAIALRQGLARFFGRHDRPAAAAAFGEPAIAALRARGEEQETQATLNVLLFNQAGYLADAGRLDDAVAALEEAVAIDRRFGLPDLASDSAALARMRRRRDGLPAEDEETCRPVIRWPRCRPKRRRSSEEAARQFAQLSPDEQEAAQIAVRRELLAARRTKSPRPRWPRSGRVGSPSCCPSWTRPPPTSRRRGCGFALCATGRLRAGSRPRCCGAHPPPPVPQAYVERFAALRQALG